MRRLLSVAPVLLWLVTPLAFAQLPGITSQPLPGGGQSWSLPVQTLVFITSLTFIPAILLMMTSFTRIIIVLVYCVTRWERPPRHLTRYCWGWHYFEPFLLCHR